MPINMLTAPLSFSFFLFHLELIIFSCNGYFLVFTKSRASRTGYPPHEASSLIAFRNFDEEMKHPGVWESDQGSTSTTDNSRDNLASLYRPPFHLMFHGSFEKVKGFSLSLLLHDLSEIIYHLVLMALVNCAGYMVLFVLKYQGFRLILLQHMLQPSAFFLYFAIKGLRN